MAIKQKDIFKLLLQRDISQNDEDIVLNYLIRTPDFLNNINNEYHLNPLFLATLHNESLAKKIIPLCKKEHFITKSGFTFLHMIAGNTNLKDYCYFLNFYNPGNYLEDENINNNFNSEHITPLLYAINNYNYRGAKAIFNLIKKCFPQIQKDYSLLFATQKEDLYSYYSHSLDKANHLYFLNKNIFPLSDYIKNYKYNSTFFKNIGTQFYAESDDNNVSKILNNVYNNVDFIPKFSTLENNDTENFINSLIFSLIKFRGNLRNLDQYLSWITKNNKDMIQQINFCVNDIIDNKFTKNIPSEEQFNEYISIIIKHIGIKPFSTDLPNFINVKKPLYSKLINILIDSNIKIETYDDLYIKHILCNNEISNTKKQKFYKSNKNVLLKEYNFGYLLCYQLLTNPIEYNPLLKNILSEFLHINTPSINKHYTNLFILPDYYLNCIPKNDEFNQKIIDSFFLSSKSSFLIPLQIEHIQNYLKFISENNIIIDFKNINKFRHRNNISLEQNIISLIEKNIIENDIFGQKLKTKNKKRL